ncbi:hypothetical protein N7445_000986 [Penicillium cf. griseofulvum]|nr:hypothetical protein N7445_000986 [Penicillium cf. griseofulvum]
MLTSSCVFIALLAAMIASWWNDLVHLVGGAVVFSTIFVSMACCLSSPRIWLLSLLQSVAKLAVKPTKENVNAEARNETLRAQLGVLEQKLRGTEARARDSEIARETEKKRHEKEVRHLDSQLVTVTRGIKGRARWAPAKKYGVRKGERGRPATKFTAIAQVAIVNAAWESKLVSLESEARDNVARTTDQIGSLHAAATALSEENARLTQQIQTKANIPHELAQQRLEDAVRRTMVFADQQHEERANPLKQTYHKELMAVKVDYERELAKATAAFKAELDNAAVQQREAAARAAQEINALKAELAAKVTQMGTLRDANAKIAGDLRVAKEALTKADHDMEVETERVVQCVQQRDGYLRAGKRLSKKYENLKSERDALVEEKDERERYINRVEDSLDSTAKAVREEKAKAEKLEGDKQYLLQNSTDVFLNNLASTIEQKGRVSDLEQQVANYQTAEAADIPKQFRALGLVLINQPVSAFAPDLHSGAHSVLVVALLPVLPRFC